MLTDKEIKKMGQKYKRKDELDSMTAPYIVSGDISALVCEALRRSKCGNHNCIHFKIEKEIAAKMESLVREVRENHVCIEGIKAEQERASHAF